MKSLKLYSQLKNNFKIVLKDMNREEIKRILWICIYIRFNNSRVVLKYII